ncbi:Uncharacterized protein HZ326_6663 [Fusarium oxysporum f. sp. albedinis]|nr:Uncharacterized protein HZ326_6663 [Fusarium oxysporum f. sp. albedinis]
MGLETNPDPTTDSWAGLHYKLLAAVCFSCSFICRVPGPPPAAFPSCFTSCPIPFLSFINHTPLLQVLVLVLAYIYEGVYCTYILTYTLISHLISIR